MYKKGNIVKNLKKISRNDLKNIVGGEWGNPGGLGNFGPSPCGGSWSASMGPQCQCESIGGIWACDVCLTSASEKVKFALTNNCDQLDTWP